MACACLQLQLRKSVSDFRSFLSTTLPSPLCHSFFSVIIDCSIFFHRWLSYQVVHRVPAKVCLVFVCHKFSNCLFYASFTTLFLTATFFALCHHPIIPIPYIMHMHHKACDHHSHTRISSFSKFTYSCRRILFLWPPPLHSASPKPSTTYPALVRGNLIQIFLIRINFAPGVPFITLVGLSLDALEHFLPGLKQLPVKRGETYVEFSWECAHSPASPIISRFRWMGAEDGRYIV